MINHTIKILDEVISLIKGKDNSESFNPKAMGKFEFEFFLCLEIVRYELYFSEKVSDEVAIYLNYVFVFPVFEYYYRDYNDIYDKCMALFNELMDYNPKLKKDELDGMSADNKNRIDFFKNTIQRMLGNQ